MSDIYNYTLGEVLKSARVEKDLAIEEIELKTKIRASYISALENSEFEKLPADLYVRGILKNYADFLDLNYEELLRLYRKEGNYLGINTADKKFYINIKSILNNIVISHKMISIIIFLIITIIIVFFLFKNYNKMVSAPSLSINLKNEIVETVIPEISIEGKTDLNTTVLINGQKIAINDSGIFKEIFNLNPGINIVFIQSISNRNNKTSIIERQILYKQQITTTNIETSNGISGTT